MSGAATAEPRHPSWSRLDTLAVCGLTLAGGALRVRGLAVPGRLVFDETYYAQDACLFVQRSASCGIRSPLSEEHPLLAKWIIASGIKLFGYTPFGWRVMPVLFGTASIAILFALARRLMGSTGAASLAAGLLSLDGLHLVQSRLAMLDIFVMTFSLATIAFAVVDRDRVRGPRERLRDRPWLLAAGGAAGCAVSTKWSGIPFLVMAVVLVLVWDRAARRDPGGSADDGSRRSRGALLADVVPVTVALVAIPAAIYVLSFAGRLDGQILALPWDRGSWAWAFFRRQAHILTFHVDLRGTYPYESPAWSWPLLKRPAVYALDIEGGSFREIVGLGNPVVWWGGSLAVVATAVRWIRLRRWDGPEGTIVAGVAAGYLWWLPVTSSRSFSFLFYFLPAVPFLCLAIAAVAQRSWGHRAGRVGTAIVVGSAALAFGFFYPVLTYRPLDAGAWTARLWFTNCRPEALTGDPPRPQLTVITPPPDGWCWI